MLKANIFNVERASFVDGPGIRTTVFFKGCNLRCKWCHNCESWEMKSQLLYYTHKCIACGSCIAACPAEAVLPNYYPAAEICAGCGVCESVCPVGARKLYGKELSVDELMQVIRADIPFFLTSNGGVTFSGGECLLQSDVLLELLKRCKEENINTAIDTAGNVSSEIIARVAEFADWFLFDIKCFDEMLHTELTGSSNKKILENYRFLWENAAEKLIVRIPVIPNCNDSDEEMNAIATFLSEYPPFKVELLPYHRLGEAKQRALGLPALDFEIPTEEHMQKLKELFLNKAVPVY